MQRACDRAHARTPLAAPGAALSPARGASASVWPSRCSSGWGWLRILVRSPRGPMGGTNRTACPAPSLALRTLKASRQPWLLLRIYESGFCLRVAGVAAQLEPQAVLPLAPPGGRTKPCSRGRLARRCPPSLPKCLGREIAASDLVRNPEIVSSFALCDL